MTSSLSETHQRLRTAVLQYATVAQTIAHQTEPDPDLDRQLQMAAAQLLHLQSTQSVHLLEQKAADYRLLVQVNGEYAHALLNKLDQFDSSQAREQAIRLDQSYQQAQDSFGAAIACLDDFARSAYCEAHSSALTIGQDELQADKVARIAVDRVIEGMTKSLGRAVDTNTVLRRWVAAGSGAEASTRQRFANQLGQWDESR